MEELQGDMFTVETLKADLKALGVAPGMTVIAHSSMKALGGWVVGGAAAVILALEQCLGEKGTLVMPTHTGDLSDPAGWRFPPVKESWWPAIRETMPAYEADLTPTRMMGLIPECFRKQNGVVRSGHPQVSFAAWGHKKEKITNGHGLSYSLGEGSPLARLYEEDGRVLLLGVGHGNNTSIHLAEYRADFAGKSLMTNTAPVFEGGVRKWARFDDIEPDSDDFERIGEAFERETNHVVGGKVANADARLMPVKPLVDFAVAWMEANRGR
ncbi:aminoglycoside N(3)-acetyltransferase [Paenibacillus arenilitoris]|uniref:Aminoglycoside N(3)-acetyltransferase n=1 Tax=Paenibacillus arenilitoris TaxID=2772299 RepID=A0A927CLJ1_9BACL|nr:AAC(3) family N-acetyltransferase [Paenibacillus arenilitoris]MBD2869427.1 AAC(3) family N-acetyltransferase [Paenibacillus arenilitoris]